MNIQNTCEKCGSYISKTTKKAFKNIALTVDCAIVRDNQVLLIKRRNEVKKTKYKNNCCFNNSSITQAL